MKVDMQQLTAVPIMKKTSFIVESFKWKKAGYTATQVGCRFSGVAMQKQL